MGKIVAERTRLMTVPSSVLKETAALLSFRGSQSALISDHDHRRSEFRFPEESRLKLIRSEKKEKTKSEKNIQKIGDGTNEFFWEKT